MNHAIDVFRDHTGKLFGVNILGVITWVAESTNVIGLIGAVAGLAAAVMLICIRWGDFVASKPVQFLLEWWNKR